MCKFGGLLIAYDYENHRALLTDADCESWKCDECKSMMRERWVLRAQHGARELKDGGAVLFFATITSHERNLTFSSCARVFPDAWGKLHKRLNRTTTTREYMLVPERHKDGRLHMHAIWTFPVKTRWLKDNGRECGFGFMNQIGRRGHIDEQIASVSEVGEYVAKYLGKALGDDVPTHFRRVRVSKNWAHNPAPETETSNLAWRHIGTNGQLLSVYEECTRERLDIIDIRTGERFDDVDLGTMTYA